MAEQLLDIASAYSLNPAIIKSASRIAPYQSVRVAPASHSQRVGQSEQSLYRQTKLKVKNFHIDLAVVRNQYDRTLEQRSLSNLKSMRTQETEHSPYRETGEGFLKSLQNEEEEFQSFMTRDAQTTRYITRLKNRIQKQQQ